MLRKETQRIHDKVFLRQPNGPALRDTEASTDDAYVDVGEFVWIFDDSYVPRSCDFRDRRTDDLCLRVQRLY